MGTPPTLLELAALKRMRSPAYPFINLQGAINRAQEFWDREQHNTTPLKIAIRHWGYEEKSSGGLQTTAALIHFGLMRDEGTGNNRKLKLTETALRILLASNAEFEDRAAAIRTAALTPKIHKQLWRKGGNDDVLKHFLTLELKPPFSPRAADALIREYRETIAFAKPNDSDLVVLANGDWMPELQEESQAISPHSIPPSKPVGSSIPVTENCVMSISATGEVTQKGIERLIAYLTLVKGSFPEN
jgi:hypothetical protein